MENQDTQDFNADAAFEEAANQLESGGLPADSKPSAVGEDNQPVPDQHGENTHQDNDPPQPAAKDDELPDWLVNTTDEVKENFRLMNAEKARFEHMAKSQRGRVGALSKKYQQALASLEQLKQERHSFDGELDHLSQDYPELAEFLSRFVAGQNKRIDDISEPIAQMVNANVQDFNHQQREQSISMVTQLVPDVEKILAEPLFQRWIDNQPNGVKALFRSDDPQDAVYLLNEYKRFTSTGQEQRNKRSQQLSAMSLPNGRSVPKGGDEIDENAFFDQLAAQFDKQRL